MEQLISRDEIVKKVRVVTEEVLSTMLGLEAKPEDAYTESQQGKADGVVSFAGFAGMKCIGTGGMQCSSKVACKLASQFLMSDYQSVDDEVLDAFGELTNMIIGNLKTSLEDELGQMGLSIPTVVFGKNFSTRSPGSDEWTVIPFSWGDDQLLVRVCLKEKESDHARSAGEKQEFVLQS
jgi:chemotaxis protein CheX